MNTLTVADLATELHKPVPEMLAQLKEAGVAVDSEKSPVSPADKVALLTHLQKSSRTGSTLSAGGAETTLTLSGKELKELLTRTQFAMAQQDVRYYLNGLLLEIRANRVRTVATDGHRLAMAELRRDTGVKKDIQVILPRKTVLELQRLVEGDDSEIKIQLSANQVQVDLDGLKLTSKLIEGRFPDYERVIPEGSDKTVHGDRGRVRAALSRAAILSNEKFRGVRLTLSGSTLKIQTQNPEQEEAEEEVEVQYSGTPLEIGFNVGYLLDALDAIEGNEFQMELRSPDASGLVYDAANNANKFVVMPMRL